MRRGFTLIELMIVIAIIATLAAIAIPALLASQRTSNERNASASLKTITTAEADFRVNDKDGNRINDFWTSDVFALYGLIPITAGATTIAADSSSTAGIVKLIEPSVAGADAAPNLGAYGNITVASSIIVGSPKAGFIYRTFVNEDSGGGASTLLNDTDGASSLYGSVHDRVRYAVMAAPLTLSDGRLLFIVNADNALWKYSLPAGYTVTYTAMSDTAGGSTITGTGNVLLDNATTFPQAPGSIGFSKMD